jgi:pimeloyl-ACP methyl ester carboxylesterase
MPTTELNGATVSYDDGGTGPAVLLSHGYSATLQMWTPTRPALERRYRVVTWDMRGHGRTVCGDDPRLYSEEATVGDMLGLLGHLGLERAVIGGLSLGGYMSLAFHRRHPEMVRALVLCDTGPGYRNDEARARWNVMAVRRAEAFEMRGLEALGRSAEVAASTHDSARGLALSARGMLTQRDAGVIDSLPDIRVPTLVIVGSEDTNYIAPSEYMAKKIPGARLEIIEGAGHAANIDRPGAFNRVLLDFLDGLPG